MALTWPALHAQLMDRPRRVSFQRSFTTLTAIVPELARFASADSLLSWLHDPGGAPEPKNRVLRALVRAAQTGGAQADTAQVLILLALWPGCGAVYGRLRRHFRHDSDRLAAEIAGRLSAMVAGLDLDRVNRIAATLVRNVERDIVRMLKREWRLRDHADLEDVEAETATLTEMSPGIEALFGRLTTVIGSDAALVVAVAVMGFSQKEAGLALGISPAAARKRYQRAIEKLRAAENSDVPF